jgi:hypothetical protein
MKHDAFAQFFGALYLILWITSGFYFIRASQQLITPQYCQGSNYWLFFAIFALIPLFIKGLRQIYIEKKLINKHKNVKDEDNVHI